jgi:GNAT superfamily N-acetyltransferase
VLSFLRGRIGMEIGLPDEADLKAITELVVEMLGPDRAGPFVTSYAERHHLLVAKKDREVVGVIAYRTDWFQCTYVALVCVHRDHRRRGIAQALFQRVEQMSFSPRIFSSTEETNAVSIRMHTALGFTPSGYIDNLPQGYRELIFYKRIQP